MKFKEINPPRIFQVGFDAEKIDISDCGRVELSADEQVTFVTESGNEYDLARKSWGFYATPSLNGRLLRFHLRAALIRNRIGQFFVFLMEEGKEAEFNDYLTRDKLQVVCWLHDNETLAKIENAVRDAQ